MLTAAAERPRWRESSDWLVPGSLTAKQQKSRRKSSHVHNRQKEECEVAEGVTEVVDKQLRGRILFETLQLSADQLLNKE